MQQIQDGRQCISGQNFAHGVQGKKLPLRNPIKSVQVSLQSKYMSHGNYCDYLKVFFCEKITNLGPVVQN